MIDQQLERIETQMGQNVESDEIKEKGLVRGDFIQLDENGQAVENKIQPKGVMISIDSH